MWGGDWNWESNQEWKCGEGGGPEFGLELLEELEQLEEQTHGAQEKRCKWR